MTKKLFLLFISALLLSCCYDLCELEEYKCTDHCATEECCDVEKETTIVKSVSVSAVHFVIVEYPETVIGCEELTDNFEADIYSPPNYIITSSFLI